MHATDIAGALGRSFTQAEWHVVLELAQLTAVVKETLRAKLLRVVPQLWVNVHRIEVCDNNSVLGNSVSAKSGFLRAIVQAGDGR